jgi:hypothetical protein
MTTQELRRTIEVFGGTPAMVGAIEAFEDPTRWREIIELNPSIDVLGLNVQEIESIVLPSVTESLSKVQPLLTSVSAGLNQASSIVGQFAPGLSGYVAEAQRLVGEVNGIVGQVESSIGSITGSRNYKEAVRLVDWLL